MNVKSSIGLVAAIVMLFVFTVPVIADTMIKQTEHMDAIEMMGRITPAHTDTSLAWLGDNRARVDKGDTISFVVHMDKNIAYVINHSAKTYGEMSMAAADNKSAKDKDADKNDAMRQMMKVEGTVTATDETKKIKKWNCKKYNVEIKLGMVSLKQEIWATEDIKVDYESFHQASNAMMSQLEGFGDLMKEFKKIKGLPILTTINVNMMGAEMKRSMEVFEIKENSSPPGGFDIPKDYKKIELQNPMQGG